MLTPLCSEGAAAVAAAASTAGGHGARLADEHDGGGRRLLQFEEQPDDTPLSRMDRLRSHLSEENDDANAAVVRTVRAAASQSLKQQQMQQQLQQHGEERHQEGRRAVLAAVSSKSQLQLQTPGEQQQQQQQQQQGQQDEQEQWQQHKESGAHAEKLVKVGNGGSRVVQGSELARRSSSAGASKPASLSSSSASLPAAAAEASAAAATAATAATEGGATSSPSLASAATGGATSSSQSLSSSSTERKHTAAKASSLSSPSSSSLASSSSSAAAAAAGAARGAAEEHPPALSECRLEMLGGRDAPEGKEKYGGWLLCANALRNGSIVYSFGIGSDVSFDVAAMERGAEVFAFDPTKVAPYVEHVMRKNHGYDRFPAAFHYHQVGLGERDTTVTFFGKGSGSMSSVPLDKITAGNYRDVGFQGRVQTLATTRRVLGHHWVDVLKIDAEGTEFDVCESRLFMRSVRGNVGQVLMEFHDRLVSDGRRRKRKCVARLLAAGFTIVHSSGRGREISFARLRTSPPAPVITGLSRR